MAYPREWLYIYFGLTRTSGINSLTLGSTSSIADKELAPLDLLISYDVRTRAVGHMDDGIPVPECICHPPNEALGPFGGRVDRNEPERSFGRSHFQDRVS